MNKENSDNTEKKQKRGAPKKYLFKKGQSGNPKGRPKGSISLLSILKKQLRKRTIDKKYRNAYLLVQKTLDKAIVDGDNAQIKLIWDYLEGMPKQNIKVEGELNINQALDEIKKIIDESK